MLVGDRLIDPTLGLQVIAGSEVAHVSATVPLNVEELFVVDRFRVNTVLWPADMVAEVVVPGGTVITNGATTLGTKGCETAAL